MGPLLEAVGVLGQPCNLAVVIVPAIAVGVTRVRRDVFFAVIAAALVGGWLLVGQVGVKTLATASTTTTIVVLAALLIGVLATRRRRVWPVALAAGAVLTATMSWKPCVGVEFAKILNAPNVISELIPMALYMVGMLTPMLAVAALIELVGQARPTPAPA